MALVGSALNTTDGMQQHVERLCVIERVKAFADLDVGTAFHEDASRWPQSAKAARPLQGID
jgi:hypothetical protein